MEMPFSLSLRKHIPAQSTLEQHHQTSQDHQNTKTLEMDSNTTSSSSSSAAAAPFPSPSPATNTTTTTKRPAAEDDAAIAPPAKRQRKPASDGARKKAPEKKQPAARRPAAKTTTRAAPAATPKVQPKRAGMMTRGRAAAALVPKTSEFNESAVGKPGESYTPVWLSPGWVLFDVERPLPPSLKPEHMHPALVMFLRYKTGAKRVVEQSAFVESVRLTSTPAWLAAHEVVYTAGGPVVFEVESGEESGGERKRADIPDMRHNDDRHKSDLSDEESVRGRVSLAIIRPAGER